MYTWNEVCLVFVIVKPGPLQKLALGFWLAACLAGKSVLRTAGLYIHLGPYQYLHLHVYVDTNFHLYVYSYLYSYLCISVSIYVYLYLHLCLYLCLLMYNNVYTYL